MSLNYVFPCYSTQHFSFEHFTLANPNLNTPLNTAGSGVTVWPFNFLSNRKLEFRTSDRVIPVDELMLNVDISFPVLWQATLVQGAFPFRFESWTFLSSSNGNIPTLLSTGVCLSLLHLYTTQAGRLHIWNSHRESSGGILKPCEESSSGIFRWWSLAKISLGFYEAGGVLL